MGFTPEQRAKAIETNRRKAEERRAAQAVMTTETQPLPTPDEASDELARLGAALAQVAGNKAAQRRVVGELEALITRLPVNEYANLLDNEVVQQFVERMTERKVQENKGDPPGTIYNRGTLAQVKKPWSWADLKDAPKKTWTPNRSTSLTWNGLTVYVHADEEVTLPEVFHGVWEDHVRATKLGREHAEWLMRKRDRLSDPGIISPEGARARATGEGGHYLPGGGNIAGAGIEETEDADSGETA